MESIIDSIDSGYKDCLFDKNGIYFLWNKLVEYAAYWELNSPTVNGNPDYDKLSSFIQGYLVAKNWDIEEEPTKIIIKNKRNQILIEMVKRPLPQSYYDKVKDINNTINNLFGD